MSESLPLDASADQMAGEIDWHFRSMARYVPRAVTLQPAGHTTELHREKGAGTLTARHLGFVSGQHSRVELRIVSEQDAGGLAFSKVFHQVYGGRMLDTGTTAPEMLADCPTTLGKLGLLLEAVHRGYIARNAASYEQPATVTSLPEETAAYLETATEADLTPHQASN